MNKMLAKDFAPKDVLFIVMHAPSLFRILQTFWYQTLPRDTLKQDEASFSSERLPGSLSLGRAFPGLAIGVVRGGRLQSRFILRQIRCLHQRLLNSLLVSEDTADRLVVEEFGELEEQGVVDGWLGLLIGLSCVSACLYGKRTVTYVEQVLLLRAFLSLFLQEDIASGIHDEHFAVLCNDALLRSLGHNHRLCQFVRGANA
jgi:hypothetical protein